MIPKDIPSSLWNILEDNLWHATSIQSAIKIFQSNLIRFDNPKSFYPDSYVRNIGAVSLFDFRGGYWQNIDTSYWIGWLGKEKRAPYAVWFCIDELKCDQSAIISGYDVYRCWLADGNNKKIIPYVEGAHKGYVKLKSVSKILIIDAFNKEVFLCINLECN